MLSSTLLTNYRMDAEKRLCLLLVGLTELRRRLAMSAHNGREWHTLLDFCAIVGCLVGDRDRLYDPALIDDRMYLGLLCCAQHKMPYVVQSVMSGSMRNSL